VTGAPDEPLSGSGAADVLALWTAGSGWRAVEGCQHDKRRPRLNSVPHRNIRQGGVFPSSALPVGCVALNGTCRAPVPTPTCSGDGCHIRSSSGPRGHWPLHKRRGYLCCLSPTIVPVGRRRQYRTSEGNDSPTADSTAKPR